jgi:hypothetical protein
MKIILIFLVFILILKFANNYYITQNIIVPPNPSIDCAYAFINTTTINNTVTNTNSTVTNTTCSNICQVINGTICNGTCETNFICNNGKSN